MKFFGFLLVAAVVVLALNACGIRAADRAVSGPSIAAVGVDGGMSTDQADPAQSIRR